MPTIAPAGARDGERTGRRGPEQAGLMTIAIFLLLGAVLTFGLLLTWARAAAWMRESRTTRFVFEDRDTYLFLKLDRRLEPSEAALVTMRALQEALRLKLAGVGYERLLVDASALRPANSRALWTLIGALGPALLDERVKVAVVCRRRTRAARLFHEAGVLRTLPSAREGERYLGSTEPRQTVALDPEQVHALLLPEGRRAA